MGALSVGNSKPKPCLAGRCGRPKRGPDHFPSGIRGVFVIQAARELEAVLLLSGRRRLALAVIEGAHQESGGAAGFRCMARQQLSKISPTGGVRVDHGPVDEHISARADIFGEKMRGTLRPNRPPRPRGRQQENSEDHVPATADIRCVPTEGKAACIHLSPSGGWEPRIQATVTATMMDDGPWGRNPATRMDEKIRWSAYKDGANGTKRPGERGITALNARPKMAEMRKICCLLNHDTA